MNRNTTTCLLILVLWLCNIAASNAPLFALTESNYSTASLSITSNFVPENDYSCIGDVIVQLNDDCRADITVPMVLKGSGVDTLTGFNVVVNYPDGSKTVNYVSGCGDFQYEVFDRENELVCWGNIIAEDKTPPVIAQPLKNDTLTCTDIDSILNRDLYDFDGRVWQRLRDSNIIDIDTAITDNCSDVSTLKLFIADDYFPTEGECTETGKIERRIQATDEKGNVSELTTITFVFIQPELRLDELADIELSVCTDGEDYVLTPEEVGAPYYVNAFGHKQYLYAADTTVCNYAVSFRDDSLAINCGYKLERTWFITNWCDQEDPRDTIVQHIKYGDLDAPVVSCPVVHDATYSTGPFDCTASIRVPAPVVTDCNADWTYTVQVYTKEPELDIFGIPTGDSILVLREEPIVGNSTDGYLATAIPIGQHYFSYAVTDACGNTAESVLCPFEVVDDSPPVAVCFDFVNISLGGNGIGSVPASEVDEGSTDNCEIVEKKLRREISEDCLDAYVDAVLSGGDGFFTFADLTKDADKNIWRYEDEIIVTKKGSIYYSAFLEEAIVSCCDVGTVVSVEMRITDKAGNTTSCWSFLQVEDKIAPVCHAPDNIRVDCDTALINRNEYGDTTLLQQYYGKATASDNCGASVKELAPLVEVDECGFGTITRRFQATDGSGNTSEICTQVITILGVFDYEIKFPEDESSAICGVSEPDTLLYQILACGDLAVEVSDEIFDAADDACYKIFRTYSIINWCEYDGISDPVVIGRDENKNGVVGEDVYLLRRRDGTFYTDDNDDETDGFFRSGSSGGFWEYTQIIKVYDKIAPRLSYEPLDVFCSYDSPGGPNDICNGDVMIPFTISDNCTLEELETRVFLDEGRDGEFMVEITNTDMLTKDGQEFVFTASLPIGEHRLQARVVDPCGNFIVKSIPFEVVDCKAPSPICIQGVTVELMPVDQDGNGVPDFGMNLVPARSLIGSEVFDCSGEVTYSINRKGEEAKVDQTNLTVNCLDPKNETIPVEIHAWDPLGNHQACETFIVVQDNGKFCSGGLENGIIAGAIYTEEDIPLEDVPVRLSGNQAATVKTNLDGVFEFIDLEEGYDYSVEPSLTGDFRNGVSTYDLVLVSKHILGVEKLTSPYQVIAADVNRSNSVTSLDLIHLRKLILSINDDFPNNTSWRFVDRDHVFLETERPWVGGIPEVVNVNNLLGTYDQANFVAVKIGDINRSARLNQTLGQNEQRNHSNPLVIQGNDQAIQSGQRYEVQLTTEDLDETMGFQFTFSFDPGVLELEEIHHAWIKEQHIGLKYLSEGLITVSWNQLQPTQAEGTLLSLSFRARADGRLADLVAINSRLTTSEAYSFNGTFRDVQLQWTQSLPDDVNFKLLQNHPNPFRDYTYIRFYLPEQADATILIQDINGALIREIRGAYQQGLNEVKLDRSDLPSGLLMYSLKSGSYQQVKKMILID
jgi:hypothetical protein